MKVSVIESRSPEKHQEEIQELLDVAEVVHSISHSSSSTVTPNGAHLITVFTTVLMYTVPDPNKHKPYKGALADL
jgi:hypothetical protein